MQREKQTTITVRTSFQGVHNYPDAPKGVEFLKAPHRHIFGICVEVEVFNNDREIEFVILKNRINRAITEEKAYLPSEGMWYLDNGSCEMIANRILELYLPKFIKNYEERYVKVTVDEDGENAATVEMWPECPNGLDELSEYIHDSLNDVPVEHSSKNKRCCKSMTLAEYQQTAYNNIQSHYNRKEEILHWAVGLGEEAGESLSVIKHKYYGGHYDVADIVGELGDTLWHIAALCTALGLNMEDVAKVNLEKLNFRYPNGQFDYNRSEMRHELGKQFEETDWYKKKMAEIRKRSDELTNKE